MYTQIGMQIERAQFRFYAHTQIFPMNDLSAKQRAKKKIKNHFALDTDIVINIQTWAIAATELLLLLVSFSMFIFCTNK